MKSITPINEIFELKFKRPLFTLDINFKREPSKLEAQIFGLLIWWIQKKIPDDNGMYKIKKSVIRKWVGWNKSKNNQDIFNALGGIVSNSIKWNVRKRDNTVKNLPRRGFSNLISDVFEVDGDDEYYGFFVKPAFEKSIKDPKVYIGINILILAILNANNANKHAHQFYSLLQWKRYLGEKTISVEEMKDSMLLKEGSYPEFKIFKRDVVNPVIKDINKYTDIWFNPRYATIRKGRKITALSMEIEAQSMQLPLFVNNEFIKEMKDEMGGHKQEMLSTVQSMVNEIEYKSLDGEDEEYINMVAMETECDRGIVESSYINNGKAYIEIRLKSFRDAEQAGGIERNKGGYFRRLLEVEGGFKQKQEEEEVSIEKRQARQNIERNKELEASIKVEYEEEKDKILEKRKSDLKKEDIEKYKTEYEEGSKGKLYAKTDFGRKTMFNIFLKEKLLTKDEKDIKKFAGERLAQIEEENKKADKILRTKKA
jgi:hypothetical protein